MRKICVFSGTRADYGLLKCLLSKLKNDKTIELQLVVSGTHLTTTHKFSYKNIEKDGFKISKKIAVNPKEDTPLALAKAVGDGVQEFSIALTKLKPDLVVVLGDRFEMFAFAQAAFFLHIPIAHIHGGESTLGVIDDGIRHAVTKLSSIHFPSTKKYASRLIKMGENKKLIFTTGAPGLDLINKIKNKTKRELELELKLKFSKTNILFTYHPVSLDQRATEEEIKALESFFSDLKEVSVFSTYPNNDTFSGLIVQMLERLKRKQKNFFVFHNLGSENYINLMKHCQLVMGNSSSGIIEAPYLGKPVINIGTRQGGRLTDRHVIHVNGNIKNIKNAYKKILNIKKLSASHLYGKGKASSQIHSVLRRINLDHILFKPFVD